MDNNFIDDDDSEEIFDENDAIEIDEDFIFAAAAQPHLFFSEESNNTENESNTSSQSALESRSQTEVTRFNFTPEQTKLLNDFSLENLAKELFSKAGTGDLLTCLYKHWKVYVPICFNAMDTPTKNLIETDSERILLKPLEVFLCNSIDSEKILNKLHEFDDPPQLCGKVFKAGEPSYFCRDCGSDPTCVLCSNCFRRSKHREHRYKMMTSGGGGYCDCGDPEAWKQHPNCELHMPKTNTSGEESIDAYINKLPKDLVQRANELFSYLMDYIFEILSIEKSQELPEHLRPDNPTDDYVTMLYNDEVHSYEQVVSTLKKVLVVDDKKSYEYAAIVDKEGRSAIKRSKKSECESIKNKVESNMSSPISTALETKVMHHSLVAHQYLAEKLLVWLQKTCEMSKGLKHILCKVSLFTKADNQNVIEKLMLYDSSFWKSARTIIHQFYIAIFFMDPYWKREFAVLYTKNYKTVWRNHVKNPDDTVSLTDLAVQMFTVISLAKYLIGNYNILQIIMESLIEHCKTNKGKLHFPRNRQRSNPEFKRAQFILTDLKYCLTSVPDKWNDELRKNFVNGFKSFVEFLNFMHGMDSLKRLTQQHIEFEPEWETSFNLLIKLQKPISSLIEWCSSDRTVFLECYKCLLHAITQLESTDELFNYKFEKLKFDSHQHEVIEYSVLKQEVSIHAPLTRLFASIYAQMNKFSLNFKTIREQLQSVNLIGLKYDLLNEKMIALIEPSIRALVLVYQTNNGFWKRNGFSLLSQVYFYSNIRCRHEMFDRDILCLQMGASYMDPNDFLINLLQHFEIFSYLTDPSYEPATGENLADNVKKEYLTTMSEDFLELLINIVSERYESYLSQIESIKKMEREVIHQLCVSPMAHSDLVKNIYPDNEKNTIDLESVLSRVAVFKNSTSTKGVYELKDEYRSYYSVYFYHYAKTDKTKSEEYQLSLKKDEKDKFFIPPRLPPLNELFANISHLLDCDVFIRIIYCILKRFANKSKIVSEGQLMRVLHLIGLALHEEQDDVDKNFKNDNATYTFKFLEKSILNNFGTQRKSTASTIFNALKSNNKVEENLLKFLTTISGLSNKNEQYKLLTEWVLNYSQKLLKLKHKIEQQKQMVEEEAKTSAQSISNDEQTQKEKRKNQIAEKSRVKLLANMQKMQKNFMETYKDLYDETKTHSAAENVQLSSLFSRIDSQISEQDLKNQVVCLGPNQTIAVNAEPKRYQCILCQEEDELSFTKPPMVLCCYVQGSKVLSKNRPDYPWMEDFDSFDPLFAKNTLSWGINTTSCGHVMHATCWQKYVDTVRLAENRRNIRIFGFNTKRNEYVCPLCETIGNTVLPLFPDLNELASLPTGHSSKAHAESEQMELETASNNESSTSTSNQASKIKNIDLSYEDWLDGLEKTLENSIKKELHDDKDVFIINPCPLSTITKLMADAVASNFKSLFDIDYLMTTTTNSIVVSRSPSTSSSLNDLQQAQQDIKLNTEMLNIMENFTRASYTFGFSTFPNDEDARMPISIWTNCAYTIQVIEQLLRYEAKPLFGHFSMKQSSLLSNIVKQAALYGITKNIESVRKSCVRLLASVLPYKIPVFDSKNIIEIDMFHLLVSLCLSMPNLYEQAKLSSTAIFSLNDSNIFKLVLQAHCVQILLTKIKYKTFATRKAIEQADTTAGKSSDEPAESTDVDMTIANDKENIQSIHDFYTHLMNLTVEKNIVKVEHVERLKSIITPQIVFNTLVKSLLPFLRYSALFFSNLTALVPSTTIEYDPKSFDDLLVFLGITNGLTSVLDIKSNGLKILTSSWLSVISQSVPFKSVKIDYPIEMNNFIDLPNDYVDLITMSMSSHVCSARASSLVDTRSESATILCLICGEMLCSQQFCYPKEIFKRRVGSCTAHAYECGGTIGVFLRVAECQVLLIHLNINSSDDMQVRGAFVPAPYLDDYGETDQGLRRGNPLHLCKTRYNKLYKDWLSHAIPEEISRSYQNQTNFVNMNWIDY